MKKKTEAKRTAILEVAEEAFRELGYERTSMAEISARLCGSKATLYNYFASKEELFVEVLIRCTEAEFQAVYAALNLPAEGVSATLQRFGVRYLNALYGTSTQAQRRLALTEAGRSPALGKLLYERGVLRTQAVVEAFLARAIERQWLRAEALPVMARHLFALLESEFLVKFLCQQECNATQANIRSAVQRAVTVYLAAYQAGN
ncbi:TetR/AcrR family transcriptional regulator [Paraburkholderia sp. A3RO-2L]|jgi:AcrR family transcriptional regulator|uniref:TetR/AcrR family transcriptional regulator n=1 Tax=unclassified Paraburkholderia TaxID=2615204 RepID=UPI003DA83150